MLRIIPSLLLLSGLFAVDLETEHLKMHCEESDRSVAPELMQELEPFYQKISETFDHQMGQKLLINLYPDIEAQHNAIGLPGGPNWIIAKATNKVIDVVSPLNPGPIHSKRSVRKIMKINVVKAVLFDKYGMEKLPYWVAFGISAWKANCTFKMMPEDAMTLSQLETTKNNKFGKLGGFATSFNFIAFTQKKFGWSRVLELAADYEGHKDELFKAFKTEFYPEEAKDIIPEVEVRIADVL